MPSFAAGTRCFCLAMCVSWLCLRQAIAIAQRFTIKKTEQPCMAQRCPNPGILRVKGYNIMLSHDCLCRSCHIGQSLTMEPVSLPSGKPRHIEGHLPSNQQVFIANMSKSERTSFHAAFVLRPGDVVTTMAIAFNAQEPLNVCICLAERGFVTIARSVRAQWVRAVCCCWIVLFHNIHKCREEAGSCESGFEIVSSEYMLCRVSLETMSRSVL